MATNLSVTHLWGNLPEGYEPSGPDDFVQQLAKILTSYVAGTYSTFNFGSSTPAAADQDKPWFRTTATGEFDRIYSYSSTYGKWVSPHAATASGNERRIWVGSESALRSYDGGDGTSDAPTATTGAMWEIDTAFAAKFPVGVGAFTNSGDVAVTGSSTTTSVSGVDRMDWDASTIPSHTHELAEIGTEAHGSGSQAHDGENVNFLVTTATSSNATAVPLTADTNESGNAATHNNLPPFYGVYFIKRSDRVYYVP